LPRTPPPRAHGVRSRPSPLARSGLPVAAGLALPTLVETVDAGDPQGKRPDGPRGTAPGDLPVSARSLRAAWLARDSTHPGRVVARVTAILPARLRAGRRTGSSRVPPTARPGRFRRRPAPARPRRSAHWLARR